MSSSGSGGHATVVGVRVRPFDQREKKFGSKCVIEMEGNATKVRPCENGALKMGKPREFIFDFAFWTHSREEIPAGTTFADQAYVHKCLGVQIVQNVFEGYNSCLFAYGQTGSGKTYSMMGIPSDPGILPRVGADIFERMERIKAQENECTVTASFCELYNDKCRDLMSPKSAGAKFYEGGEGALKIRQHPQQGVFVEGIIKIDVTSKESFISLLSQSLSNRATASTNCNATSSRSHAIVLLNIFQKDTRGSRVGKLSLVDLAGSERSHLTGATGSTAAEGNSINQSLTVLGMVLSRLADRAESKSGLHIPYRDSALTWLLSDNLGGNSKTAMLAAVSPASLNYEETISTLRFATVAKKVKNVVTVNENPNDKIIRELRDELTTLKARLITLQTRPKATTNGGGGSPKVNGDSSPLNKTPDTPKSLEGTARSTTMEAMEAAERIQEDESALRDLEQEPVSDADFLKRFPSNSHFKLSVSHLSLESTMNRTNMGIMQSGSDDDGESPRPHFDAATVAGSEPMYSAKPSFYNKSQPRELFVDWRAPQLINLRPENKDAVFAYGIEEGLNEFEMDTYTVCLVYAPLEQQVVVFTLDGEGVFLNGERVEDEGNILRHGDRIVVGEDNAFRFVYPIRQCNDFSISPTTFEHLFLLERYERAKVREDREKNAASIGKAYFAALAILNEEDAPEMRLTPRGAAASSTPRSSNPMLAMIGDDIAQLNQLVFRLEMELAEDYPAEVNDEVVVEESEYTEALDEKQMAVTLQQGELEKLRIEIAGLNFDKVPESARGPSKKLAQNQTVQEVLDSETIEGDLEREAAWHRKMRALKQFRVKEGPRDPIDNELWRRLDIDAPFISDPALKIQRTLLTQVADAKTGYRRWKGNYVCASPRFLFLFDEAKEANTCRTAIYLLGAIISDVSKKSPATHEGSPPTATNWSASADDISSANMLSDNSNPSHVISVCPAVTRSPNDPANSSAECGIHIGFPTAKLMQGWMSFLIEVSTPPMPLSMLKRSAKESMAMAGTVDAEILESDTSIFSGTSTLLEGNFSKNRKLWKPDASVTSCEACNKNFIPIIRQRHHCRACGGIFCSSCLISRSDKRCKDCAATVRRASRVAITRRKNIIMSDRELPQRAGLREDFVVVLDVIARGGNEFVHSGGAAAIKRRAEFEAMRESLSPRGRRKNAEEEDDDGTIFRVDHFRGRAHNISGDEMISAERCAFNTLQLYLKLTDNSQVTLTFVSALERERCFESLCVLMGQRVYIGGLNTDLVEIADIIVTNEVGEDCFIRATSLLSTDAKIWCGAEDGRSIPLHGGYAFWAFIGYKETWSEHTLQTYNLHLVCKAKVAGNLFLYVIVHERWLRAVVSHCICAVQINEHFDIAAVGLRIMESRILIIANEFKYDGDGDGFVDIANHPFTMKGISTMDLPAVDTIQQYEHTILLNCPAGTRGFTSACDMVQYSSPTIIVEAAGRSAAEIVVPCTNFQFSKVSDAPERGRFVMTLQRASFKPKQQMSSQRLITSQLPKGDLTSQCQLWSSVGFDRTINGEIVTDPAKLRSVLSAGSTQNPYGSILISNPLVEYYSLGILYVVVSDLGTVSLNIAQCMAGGDVCLPCEIRSGGELMAVVELTIKAEWTTTFDPVKAASSIS